ncbi:hypothetical protein PQX77_006144 [Marasmius sp. AFHP31]|nr:hypothetical protein PQX77_006144 [Marasmius sp. AFHP31]
MKLALAFLLFPLPRVVWQRIHRFALDERKSIRTIRFGLKGLLTISTLYALSLCFESLIRLIHFGIRADRHGWGWGYYLYKKLNARDSFFIAGPTFLMGLALHRVLYIVVTHLHLQEHLKEVYGKDVRSQPEDLSSKWLYKRRTMQDVRDSVSNARDAVSRFRSSLGLTGYIRLPASDSDSENGSGNQFRDEVIARQEREIADLRRALTQVPSPTGSDNTVRLGPGYPGPATGTVPPGVEALISSQEREIAELKDVIKNFSENLKAQAASQVAEFDRLSGLYTRASPEDADGKGKSTT